MASQLHTFLAGTGTDHRARTVVDILALSDARLETVHDYIQWLFPLPERSGAQPDAPVLTPEDIAAIRYDSAAQANLRAATERMLVFLCANPHWLRAHDHNHLRISRIIRSLALLVGSDEARVFRSAIMAMNKEAGSPVDPGNVRYWQQACPD
jgi:hypothetical protein